MESHLIFWLILIIDGLFIKKTSSNENSVKKNKRWFIGRVPPSRFEYSSINGFYSPKKAKNICEKDLQCGGFTFKGTKTITSIKPEVYFFHYINEESDYLTSHIKYPHWTTYIVGSRDYIAINGAYKSKNSTKERIQSK